MRSARYLSAFPLIAATAALAADSPGSPSLIPVSLSPVYSLAVPSGAEARTRDGTLIATLGSAGDAGRFGSAAGEAIEREQEIVLLPTPDHDNRKIEVGWTKSAEYAQRINSMSRLEFIMHQSIMKRAFLGDLAKKPGQHAAESSAITFHDRYRGIFYFALSNTSTAVVGRLILDVFRDDAMYSATFHWTQPSIEDRDALIDRIVDSVQVAE